MKKDKSEQTISTSLIENISDPNLGNTLTDVAELAIDTILDDGVLKDLPIIGTLVNITKATASIRDKIFAKKLLLFLKSLDSCPIDKRLKFIEKIEKKPKEKERLGEKLIILLERLDQMNKPMIIGNLFKAFMQEDLSYYEFSKISNIVSNVQLEDLYYLKDTEGPLIDMSTDILEYLAMNGLMNIGISSPMNANDFNYASSIYYVPNSLAHKLFKFGF